MLIIILSPNCITSVLFFHNTAAHKPPLNLYGLNARYANATYVAASKTNALEQVESELLAIKNSATSSKAFASFLENPLISRDEKTKNVEDMLKGKHHRLP